MRHSRNRFRVSKATDQRLAFLRSIAIELLSRDKVETTYSKALAAKRIAEKVISLAKKGDLSSRRQIYSMLANDKRIKGALDELSQRYGERPGGFVRVTKIGTRRGDSAPLALLELV